VEKIIWTNEKRKLGDLTEWEKNPRQINKDQARRLRQSLSEFGQVQAIAIDPDNMIIDGHQRRAVWGMADEYGLDFVVDVRVASRKLTDKEQQKLTIFLGKGAVGEWDFDALANFFQVDDLIDWGFKEYELGIIGEGNPDTTDLWEGMPEFEQDDLSPIQTIKVNFATIQDREAFAELVGQKLTGKTQSIWYPEQVSVPMGRAINE